MAAGQQAQGAGVLGRAGEDLGDPFPGRLGPPDGYVCGTLALRAATRGAWVAPANQPWAGPVDWTADPPAEPWLSPWAWPVD